MKIKVVNGLFLSPLRNIPGPFLARLTPLWLRYIDMSGTRTKTLHALHQRYGTTVVIGPNEITVNDISNVKELYGQLTTFVKAPIYESMTMKPHGIFGLRDRVAHGQRRKLLSHAFSQSNLQECEPLIQRQLDKLLAAVQQSAGNPIDVLRWFRLAAFDVVGASTSPYFRHCWQANLVNRGALSGPVIRRSRLGPDATVSRRCRATWKAGRFAMEQSLDYHLTRICPLTISPLLPWHNAATSRCGSRCLLCVRGFFTDDRLQHGADAFRRYIEQYGRESGRRDLLTKILSAKPDTGVQPLTDLEVSVEIGNLVFAGTGKMRDTEL